MNFKKVRRGYDPVQVESFISTREIQNNAIIAKQQTIIDVQAAEIKKLEEGLTGRTASKAALLSDVERAELQRKCELFAQTCELFERLVKNNISQESADSIQNMAEAIRTMQSSLPVDSLQTVEQQAGTTEVDATNARAKHLLELDEIMKGEFTLESMLNNLKDL